jgi:hypothetical protein
MILQPSFIMIDKEEGKRVYPSRPYQSDSLTDYIENNRQGKWLYVNAIDSTIKYHIGEFDKSGLSGNYNDVYTLFREDGTSSPISRNENKIRNLAAYINRIVS